MSGDAIRGRGLYTFASTRVALAGGRLHNNGQRTSDMGASDEYMQHLLVEEERKNPWLDLGAVPGRVRTRGCMPTPPGQDGRSLGPLSVLDRERPGGPSGKAGQDDGDARERAGKKEAVR